MHCSGAAAAAANDPTIRNTILADPNMVCPDSGATVSLCKADVSDTTWENFRPDVHVKISGIGPTAIYSDGYGPTPNYSLVMGSVNAYLTDFPNRRDTTVPRRLAALRVTHSSKDGSCDLPKQYWLL